MKSPWGVGAIPNPNPKLFFFEKVCSANYGDCGDDDDDGQPEPFGTSDDGDDDSDDGHDNVSFIFSDLSVINKKRTNLSQRDLPELVMMGGKSEPQNFPISVE